jgi:hypothetical protein
VYTPIIIGNIGNSTCQLTGYPMVTLLTAAGSPIGAPATDEPNLPETPVTLVRGASAQAVLHTNSPGIAGPCRPAASRLEIALPGSSGTLTIPAGGYVACGTFTVRPIEPNASPSCHSNELAGSLGAAEGALGTLYRPIVLRNIGSRTCTVEGFPGVSILDSAGTQLGQPATRENVAPGVVSLPPEASASALLTTDTSVHGGPCTAATTIRVYPPHEWVPLLVPADGYEVCDQRFTVRPVVAGVSRR